MGIADRIIVIRGLLADTNNKLCAVSEALLGVSCYSCIFSLKKDDDNVLKRIADNMGITFVDYDILTTPRKLRLAMAKIDIQAKETIGSLRKTP